MLDASAPILETRYPALRVISGIFKVLAVLAAIAGIIGALIGLMQMSGNSYGATATGGMIVVISLLYGGLACVYFFAVSEGIRVFLDLEVNTRLTNELLTRLLNK